MPAVRIVLSQLTIENAGCVIGNYRRGRDLILALVPHANAVQNLVNVTSDYTEGFAEQASILTRWEMLWLTLPNIKTLVWTISVDEFHCRDLEAPAGLGLPPSLLSLDLQVVWGEPIQPDFMLETVQCHRYREKLRSLRLLPGTGLPAHMTGFAALNDFNDLELSSLTNLHMVAREVTGILHAPNLISLTLKIEDEEELSWGMFTGCRQLQIIAICLTGDLCLLGHTFPTSLQMLCLDVKELWEDECLSSLDMSAASVLSLVHIVCSVGINSNLDLTPFTHTSRECSINMQHGKCHVLMPPSENSIELTWQRLANASESRSQHVLEV